MAISNSYVGLPEAKFSLAHQSDTVDRPSTFGLQNPGSPCSPGSPSLEGALDDWKTGRTGSETSDENGYLVQTRAGRVESNGYGILLAKSN